MKKRGISLIVLVITIVVVVILALAVILSITNNNPIENAKKAAFLNDMAVIKDEFSIYLHKKMIETNGEFDVTELEKMNIQEIIPSLSGKYANKIEIKNGQLLYVDTDNIQEYIWAKESFEGGTSNIDVAKKEDSTVEISNATEGKLENLKIYGNNIEGKGVGNKVKNLFNMLDAVNGDTILDNGDGTLTVTGYPAYTNKRLLELAPDLKVGDKIAFCIKTTGYSSIYLYNRSTSFGAYFNNGGTYTITQELLDSIVYLYRQTGAQGGQNAVISGIQIEYGDIATEYEPYDADHLGKYKIPVTVRGKNEIEVLSNSKTLNGVEITVNKDKSITLNGTATANITYPINSNEAIVYRTIKLKENTKYTLNGGVSLPDKVYFQIYGYINSSSIYKTFKNTPIVFETGESELWGAYLRIDSGAVFDNITLYPQLEEGEHATAYQPYIESKTYNIYLNEPLRKVENAVDYIDFKRGKVIRKVGTEKTESIVLPDIFTKNGNNIIEVGTSVAPSNIEVIYNKEK